MDISSNKLVRLLQSTMVLHHYAHPKHMFSALTEGVCINKQLTKLLPSPLHSLQDDCICCTIPGPIWRMVTLMPRPLHPGQVRTAPAFPPALPKIWSMLFRLSQENLIGHTIFLTGEKYRMTNQKPDMIFVTNENNCISFFRLQGRSCKVIQSECLQCSLLSQSHGFKVCRH